MTAADYATLAGALPGVQRAAAELRWNGSWYEAEVAVDALATADAPEWLIDEVADRLHGVRRLGHDLVVAPADTVPIDLALVICVDPQYLRAHVVAAVLAVLGTAELPDGTRGMFHPDELTFGTPVRVSQIIARVTAVAGVTSAEVTRLRRLFGPGHRRARHRGARVRAAGDPALRQRPGAPRTRPADDRRTRRAMNDCGCCTGIMLATPAPLSNQPGLEAIARRVGTHGRFLDSMLARLSSPAYPELADLQARTPDDPAIALLDSWAAIADILTFYTERIANEGYLRTATEPQSIARLGRLVGFTSRPGLGASVFLAYTLLADPARDTSVTIPAGSRAQSVPGPGELPQSYETGADLPSRASWNDLDVQQTTPVLISPDTAPSLAELSLAGTDTQVRPGDRLLLVFAAGADPPQRVLTVRAVTTDAIAGRTTVQLQNDFLVTDYEDKVSDLGQKLSELITNPPPGSAAQGLVAQVHNLSLPLRPARGLADLVPPDQVLPLLELLQSEVGDALVFAGRYGQAAVTAWLTPLRDPLDAARQAAEQLVLATEGPAGLPGPPRPGGTGPGAAVQDLRAIVGALRKPASQPPPTPSALDRSAADRFAAGSDAAAQLLIAADPRLAGSLYDAWSSLQVGAQSPLSSLLHLRVRAAPFGATAPLPPPSGQASGGAAAPSTSGPSDWPLREPNTKQLYLDTVYDGIVAGSWAVIDEPGRSPLVTTVAQADTVARADYGITGRVTRLTLNDAWLHDDQTSLGDIRPVTVHLHSVPLSLMPAPVTDDIAGDTICLDHPYPGLQAGTLADRLRGAGRHPGNDRGPGRRAGHAGRSGPGRGPSAARRDTPVTAAARGAARVPLPARERAHRRQRRCLHPGRDQDGDAGQRRRWAGRAVFPAQAVPANLAARRHGQRDGGHPGGLRRRGALAPGRYAGRLGPGRPPLPAGHRPGRPEQRRLRRRAARLAADHRGGKCHRDLPDRTRPGR